MARIFCIFFFSLGFFFTSCTDDSSYGVFLPQDTHTILSIHRSDDFLRAIEQQSFWKTYAPKLPDAKTQALLATFAHHEVRLLYTASEIYCIQPKEKADVSLWNPDREVKQAKVGNYLWNYSFYGDELIISTSPNLYNEINLFRTSDKRLHIDVLPQKNSSKAVATLAFNRSKSLSFFEKIFAENFYYFFQGWSAWDLILEEEKLQMVGSSKHYKDSLALFTLVDTKINHHDTFESIPGAAVAVQSYSFSGGKKWAEAYEVSVPLVSQIRELSFFDFKGETFAAVAPASSEGFIRHFMVIDEQKLASAELLTLEISPDMEKLLDAFDQNLSPSYALLMGNNVLFAENKKLLQELATTLQQKQNLQQAAPYKSLMSEVASKSPYWSIRKIPAPWGWVALQTIAQDDAFVYTFTARSTQTINRAVSSQQELEVAANHGVKGALQLVNNHRTGEKEVIFQDEELHLNLASAQGEILWRKKLDAPIVGAITQVDILKNKKLQYAFSTEKSVYVVDRNGNDVSGFPLRSKEKLLPLRVFDYDLKKDYRLVMSSAKSIHLYDAKGKKVEGFAGERPDGELLHAPKHFRIKGKDYIVYIQADGKLKILHRNGLERVPIAEQFAFSKNEIYEKNGQLTFTTQQGKQCFIGLDGKLFEQEKGLAKEHFFEVNGGEELFLTDNTLWAAAKKITLPSGYYSWVKSILIASELYYLAYNDEYKRLYWISPDGKSQLLGSAFGSADVAVQGSTLFVVFLKDSQTIVLKKMEF